MAHELSRTQRRNLAKRQKPGNKPTRAERLVLYLRAAGVLSSAFSAATLMLLPDAFLYFIILVYAAILFWGADLFYELRGHGRAYQVPPLVVGSVFLVLFSLQFVLPKLHLTEFAWSTNGAYHAGMTVNGILWRSKFSDLHVTISNDSDYDYAQVSLLIKPQYPVIAATLVTTIPNASLSRENPITVIDLQLWQRQTGISRDIPVDWLG